VVAGDQGGGHQGAVNARAGTAPQSVFVSAVAWMFIALSVFTTFVALLQNVMLAVFFSRGVPRYTGSGPAQWLVSWMLANVQAMLAVFLVLSVLLLVSSIGLLKRMNWARRLFIALLVVGIVASVVSLALTFVALGFRPPPSGAGAVLVYGITAFNAAGFIALWVVLGWIVRKLRSPNIRREFVSEARS
jgi:hypothetical protein